MYEMYSWVANKRPVPPRLFFFKKCFNSLAFIRTLAPSPPRPPLVFYFVRLTRKPFVGKNTYVKKLFLKQV